MATGRDYKLADFFLFPCIIYVRIFKNLKKKSYLHFFSFSLRILEVTNDIRSLGPRL